MDSATLTMSNLPPWNDLRNEIMADRNMLCVVRGKEYIKLGQDVWIGYFTLIDGSGGLTIGDRVSISSGVHIYTHDSSRYRQFELTKDPENGTHIDRAPVVIGSNVQIGANSVVLMGVTIGDNVVIGAGSVVNRDLPSNCVAAGNPVRILKTGIPYDTRN